MEPSSVYKAPEASFYPALTLPLWQAFEHMLCAGHAGVGCELRMVPASRRSESHAMVSTALSSQATGGKRVEVALDRSGAASSEIARKDTKRIKLQGIPKDTDNFTSASTWALGQAAGTP